MFSKRVILTLFIAFMISVLIGLLSNKIPTEELKKQFFAYKIHSGKTYDLLIAGDSRVFRGVSSQPFEDKLGLRSFNLGFSAVIFDDIMFDLVEQKLDRESKSPTIIVAITPHSLTKYSYPNGHIKKIQKMKREDVLMYRYFLRATSVFTPYSFSGLLKFSSGAHSQEQSFHQEFFKEQGWIYSKFETNQLQSALKSYHSTFNKRKIDSVIQEGLYDQIRIWKSKGYEVFGFIPPSSPNIESLERSYSGFLDQEIAKNFMAHDGKWISIDSIYDSYDGSHLTGESAIRLSNEIAYKIKMGYVDSIYDETKNYPNNYLPSNKPITAYHNNFEGSEYSYKTENGQIIGKIDTATLFFNTANINSETIIRKKIKKIITRAQFLIPHENAKFQLVYQIKRADKSVIYKKLSSKWILKKQVWGQLYFELIIPEGIQQGDLINCYIYNNDKVEFYIDDLEILFY